MKTYQDFDLLKFKNNEVLFEKPISSGFSSLELSKLYMYETYYDILQPFLGQEKIQLHYMDCGSFVLSSIKISDLVKDSIKLQEEKHLFDFDKCAKDHPLYSKMESDVIGIFKFETPGTAYIDKI